MPIHEAALKEALSFIESTTDPVAVVAAGSIIRGSPDKNSDLDIYVIHDAPWRCRIQRYFNGVPTEIFVNHFDHVHTYFAEEDRTGRAITAHMLATDVLLQGADEYRIGAIVEAAREWLERPVAVELDSLTLERYLLACRIEDTLDLHDRDFLFASALLAAVIPEVLRFACRRLEGRIPRDKDLRSVIERIDPHLGNLLAEYLGTEGDVARFERGLAIAQRVLGELGFFEWESPRMP
jgi:Nucleotidyltransferase domain